MTTATEQALPTGTWALDAVHSNIAFAVDYAAGTFTGGFAKVDAKLADGTLTGSAEVASIQVKDPNLEAHLQSPEFFDAERHPQLSFAAKDVARDGDEVTLKGELTIKGHTEAVEIKGRITDPITDAFGNERFGLKLETTVDRTVYGINWNNPLPDGRPSLANDVTITAELQLVRAEA